MKRFFFLVMLIWRQQLRVYVMTALLGAIVGIFVLAPSYEYINSREHSTGPLSSIKYVLSLAKDLLMGDISQDNLMLILFYAEIGAMLGLFSLVIYKVMNKRLVNLDYLKTELNKDLATIIRQGEGSHVEFKSSLRWDMSESCINRKLEGAVLKTLAGFLNSHIGGTLLIGVADDGQIIGLEKDYQTLKKTDQDGFEQALMTLIAKHLGGDLCSFVHILFYAIEKKEACRIIVEPANRPVFLEQGSNPKLFVRTGGATRDLNIEEALAYVKERWK